MIRERNEIGAETTTTYIRRWRWLGKKNEWEVVTRLSSAFSFFFFLVWRQSYFVSNCTSDGLDEWRDRQWTYRRKEELNAFTIAQLAWIKDVPDIPLATIWKWWFQCRFIHIAINVPVKRKRIGPHNIHTCWLLLLLLYASSNSWRWPNNDVVVLNRYSDKISSSRSVVALGNTNRSIISSSLFSS